MVSMKDIAQRCGVSVATVSKALNDQSDIGEDTRERIRRAADEMGYVTHAAARALKANRTYNIGILFADEKNSGLTHPYFAPMLESLKVEAEAHGYDVTFINKNVGSRSTTYLQHCLYRQVDGVIVACVNFTDPQVLELIHSDLPVVTIDHVFNNRLSVISDNVHGVEALMRYVFDRGHRKIAFIHGTGSAVAENRMTGFYRACEELGLDLPPEYLVGSPYQDAESCAEATRRLLSLPDRPTCILFPDDYSAIGGMNAIREAGLQIGEDISVAGYDGIALADIFFPRLTTYHQDTLTIGRTAAKGLVDLVERPKTTIPDRIVISGSLRVRESVKDIR